MKKKIHNEFSSITKQKIVDHSLSCLIKYGNYQHFMMTWAHQVGSYSYCQKKKWAPGVEC